MRSSEHINQIKNENTFNIKNTKSMNNLMIVPKHTTCGGGGGGGVCVCVCVGGGGSCVLVLTCS